MAVPRKHKAFVGDGILSHYARHWCLTKIGGRTGTSLSNTVCSNANLAGYAKEVLLEPDWDGTAMEVYLFELYESRGHEAAEQLVVSICEWTAGRLNMKLFPSAPTQHVCAT